MTTALVSAFLGLLLQWVLIVEGLHSPEAFTVALVGGYRRLGVFTASKTCMEGPW
ncbi:hypothetical protein HOD50_08790 [Candidatus Bathyarchaeota archaeon]|nr:hypothetical protein [Candidatus Bathyarchaeota archaeon]